MSGLENILFDNIASHQKTDTSVSDSEAAKIIYNRLTPIQKGFVDDRARKRAVRASRRTGKSFAVCSEAFIICLNKPRANVVYITLTRSSGKKILWLLMKRFNEELSLGIKFNNTELIATFRNGSQISIVGAGDRGEMEKLRGQAFDAVYIDECKSFHPAILDELIDEVLLPALLDHRGRLALVGTPGAILSGPFYNVTQGELDKHRLWKDREAHKGKWEYSVHIWKMWENEALSHLWEDALELKASKGWADSDPRWIREYLGEWIASDDALVYRYNKIEKGFNNWEPDRSSDNKFGLPSGHDWKYLLGVDLGFEDPTAFVVAAYSTTHENFYQVWDSRHQHLTVPEINAKIDEIIDIFGEFEVMIGDFGGLGKTVMQTLSTHYGKNIIPAEKKEKFDHIELLNSDLLSGNCKIRANSNLAEEMEVLQWDSTGLKEHSGCSNHCCDAFLYLWRYSYHYLREPVERAIERGSAEYWKEWDRMEYEKACREYRRKSELSDYGFYTDEDDYDRFN